jgi:hypothetical protein
MKPDLSARWGSDEFVSGQWRTRDLSPFYLALRGRPQRNKHFPKPGDKESLSHSPKLAPSYRLREAEMQITDRIIKQVGQQTVILWLQSDGKSQAVCPI